MTGDALYNDIEPYPCDWLQSLMDGGAITRGRIDRRSIRDLQASDLAGFRRVHLFAGIAGWDRALQLAGWPDERPVWTLSCPCQPFSVAGKGKGQTDDRHLWPAAFRLIRECRPSVLFGEQVPNAVKHGWLDRVFADLEGEGYACGAAVLPACAAGAPQRRDRLWFVAYDAGAAERGRRLRGPGESGSPLAQRPSGEPAGSCDGGYVADRGCGGVRSGDGCADDAEAPGSLQGAAREQRVRSDPRQCSGDGIVGGTDRRGWEARQPAAPPSRYRGSAVATGGDCQLADSDSPRSPERQGISCHDGAEYTAAERDRGNSNHWSNYRWIIGADGKARRVGLRVRKLADGLPGAVGGAGAAEMRAAEVQEEVIPLLAVKEPARVGKLRGFGNAIVPQCAAIFIRMFLDYERTLHP